MHESIQPMAYDDKCPFHFNNFIYAIKPRHSATMQLSIVSAGDFGAA